MQFYASQSWIEEIGNNANVITLLRDAAFGDLCVIQAFVGARARTCACAGAGAGAALTAGAGCGSSMICL